MKYGILVSLFCANHVESSTMSFSVSLFRESRSVSFTNKLVSSAKSMIWHALLLMAFEMSLMYTKNSSGPKTEPWWTSVFMFCMLDSIPFA